MPEDLANRLGRIPSPEDNRDRLFPMSLALPAVSEAATPRWRYWTGGKILDQGDTPHCVGFSWAGWMGISPVRSLKDYDALEFMGHDIYAACKLLDGIPTVDGTYVRTGATVQKNRGRLSAYLWANTPEELRAWLLTKGPVVVGTDWLREMFWPDKAGLISVNGELAGGHAYLLTGYNRDRNIFRIQNSWGTTWGVKGRAWVKGADMDRLLFDRGGEAVTAEEVLV